MNPKTTLQKLLPALAAVILVSLATSAQARPQRFRTSGMFGVANGQIARINAAHIGNPEIRPIRLEMAFVDASGTVVARDTKNIAPGEAVSFDFKFDASLKEKRIELRAIVRAQSPPDPDKNLKITIEVFDGDTGKNSVYYGNPEI